MYGLLSKASLEEDLVVLDVTEAEVAALRKQDEVAQTDKEQKQREKARERLQKEADVAKAALDQLEAELASKGEGERMGG